MIIAEGDTGALIQTVHELEHRRGPRIVDAWTLFRELGELMIRRQAPAEPMSDRELRLACAAMVASSLLSLAALLVVRL